MLLMLTLLLATAVAAVATGARAQTACPSGTSGSSNFRLAVDASVSDCGATDAGGDGSAPTGLVRSGPGQDEFGEIQNDINLFQGTGTITYADLLNDVAPAGRSQRICNACTSQCTHANLFRVTQDTLKDIQQHPRTFGNTRACLLIDGVVLGDMTLSRSDDCVFIPAGSFMKGSIDFLEGDDCLMLDAGGAFAGRLDFAEGSDDLVAHGAKVSGRVRMGSGRDYAIFETIPADGTPTAGPNVAYAALDGGINLGEGDDTLWLKGEGVEWNEIAATSPSISNRPVIVDLVEGREGDDKIVAHHAIVSIIDGGDGADTIQLQDGTVAELVDGEDGRDVIVTNYPATTTQADRTSGAAEPDFGQAVTVSLLSGGDGNDCAVVFGPAQIAIAGDDMSGFVGKIEMGRGDDTLSLGARTVVGGPIEMGEDRDHIMLRMGLINNDVNRAEVMCIAMDDTQDSVGATGQFGSLFVNGDITLDRRSKTNVAEFMTVAQAAAHNQNILINGALTLADQSLGPDAATCTFTSSEGGTAELGTATQEVLVARDGVTGCESTPGQFDVNP